MLRKWTYGMILCHGSLTFFDVDYFYPSMMMVGMDMLLLSEILKIDLKEKAACGAFFKKNNVYGIGILMALIMLNLIRWSNTPR